MVVMGEGAVVVIRGTVVVIRENGCNEGQWLLLGEMVVMRDSGSNGGTMVVMEGDSSCY